MGLDPTPQFTYRKINNGGRLMESGYTYATISEFVKLLDATWENMGRYQLRYTYDKTFDVIHFEVCENDTVLADWYSSVFNEFIAERLDNIPNQTPLLRHMMSQLRHYRYSRPKNVCEKNIYGQSIQLGDSVVITDPILTITDTDICELQSVKPGNWNTKIITKYDMNGVYETHDLIVWHSSIDEPEKRAFKSISQYAPVRMNRVGIFDRAYFAKTHPKKKPRVFAISDIVLESDLYNDTGYQQRAPQSALQRKFKHDYKDELEKLLQITDREQYVDAKYQLYERAKLKYGRNMMKETECGKFLTNEHSAVCTPYHMGRCHECFVIYDDNNNIVGIRVNLEELEYQEDYE